MALRHDIDHARKIELSEMARGGFATINGNKALIMGGLKNEDFARVWDTKTQMEIQFSWSAVESIMTTKSGKFFSA